MAAKAKRKATPRKRGKNTQRVPLIKSRPEPAPTKWYDRQPEEKQRAWHAFCTYRDLGPTRSTRRVAEQLGISVTMAQNYQAQFRWVERIRAWQADQDAIFADARAEHLRTMAQRQTGIAMKMQGMVFKRIRKLEEDIKRADAMIAAGREIPKGMRSDLSPREMAYWLRIAVDVERVAMGVKDPDSVPAAVQVEQRTTITLTNDERMAEIRRLMQRRKLCGRD